MKERVSGFQGKYWQLYQREVREQSKNVMRETFLRIERREISFEDGMVFWESKERGCEQRDVLRRGQAFEERDRQMLIEWRTGEVPCHYWQNVEEMKYYQKERKVKNWEQLF